MLPKIAIAGGSSPFTAALIDALADPAQGVPAAHLTLQGRTVAALELLAAYARHQLGDSGWQITHTTDIDAALDGSHIIVHQIRYGGLAGRAADEKLAAELGVPADETLGPAGLQAALRAAPELRKLGDRAARVAPSAWLLNLTNPLSVATSLLAESVGPKCVGLCELPWYTASEACRLLGVLPAEASWCYAGLNHRGFVYRLTHGSDNLLTRLAALPDTSTICGIGPDVIRRLGALPLKYFRLMLGDEVLHVGRAGELEDLRAQILSELADAPDKSPPSLARREMPWYPLSVAPVVASILNDDRRQHVLNVADDPVVRELPVEVRTTSWQRVDQPRPGKPVQGWLDRFEAHEKAVLAAVRDASRERIAEAVRLDPLTPADKGAMIAQRLSDVWARSQVSP